MFSQDNKPRRSAATNPIDQIQRLYAQGATLKELSHDLGMSEEKIRRLMIAAGIPRRPRGQPVGKYLPNGGRTVDKNGYVLVKADDHPYANHSGYVREHRLVMENLLGRYLRPEEVVHHRDRITCNNAPENLELYASNSEHKRDDMVGNSWAKGDVGNPKRRVRTMRSETEILDAISGRVCAACPLHSRTPSLPSRHAHRSCPLQMAIPSAAPGCAGAVGAFGE